VLPSPDLPASAVRFFMLLPLQIGEFCASSVFLPPFSGEFYNRLSVPTYFPDEFHHIVLMALAPSSPPVGS
jgi:hypothetical protein